MDFIYLDFLCTLQILNTSLLTTPPSLLFSTIRTSKLACAWPAFDFFHTVIPPSESLLPPSDHYTDLRIDPVVIFTSRSLYLFSWLGHILNWVEKLRTWSVVAVLAFALLLCVCALICTVIRKGSCLTTAAGTHKITD